MFIFYKIYILFIFVASLFQKTLLSNPLRGILDVNRLISPNYTDLFRNFRIILTTEKIVYVLNTVIPTPEEGANEDEIAHYMKYIDDSTLT